MSKYADQWFVYVTFISPKYNDPEHLARVGLFTQETIFEVVSSF